MTDQVLDMGDPKATIDIYITFKLSAGTGNLREGPYRVTREVLLFMHKHLNIHFSAGRGSTGHYPAIAITNDVDGNGQPVERERPTILLINYADVLMIG